MIAKMTDKESSIAQTLTIMYKSHPTEIHEVRITYSLHQLRSKFKDENFNFIKWESS